MDLNLRQLRNEGIFWSDHVFLTGMAVQAEFAHAVIAHCNEIGRKVVAGGPLSTARHEEFPAMHHFVLNEAEITLPLFIEDLKHG